MAGPSEVDPSMADPSVACPYQEATHPSHPVPPHGQDGHLLRPAHLPPLSQSPASASHPVPWRALPASSPACPCAMGHHMGQDGRLKATFGPEMRCSSASGLGASVGKGAYPRLTCPAAWLRATPPTSAAAHPSASDGAGQKAAVVATSKLLGLLVERTTRIACVNADLINRNLYLKIFNRLLILNKYE